MTDSAAHLPNSAEQLSEVLLQLYEPHLKNVKVQLQELVCKQEQLCKELEIVNDSFAEHKLQPADEMMLRHKSYKEKLVKIRKQMLEIHQKTKNLKKRAIFIRDFKTKEAEERTRKRLQEEALIGHSLKSSGSN